MSDAEESDAAAESISTDTTRREVLSAVGGVPMSVPFAAGVDVNWGSDRPHSDRVEYVERLEHTNPTEVRREGAAPERTEVTDTVSRDHWLVVETAHDAKNRVQKLISQHTSDPLIMTGVTTITDGGQSKKAVTVDRITQKGVDSTTSPDIGIDELKGIVPDTAAGSVEGTTVDGIPVITREQTRKETVDCSKYTYTEDYGESIPGAARYEAGCSTASLGTPAVDNDTGERKMLTCGHCFKYGDTVRQPTCGTSYDGEKNKKFKNPGIDFASIKPPNNKSGKDIYKYRLASESEGFYTDRYISGIITKSSLKYNEGDTGYEIVNQGARTGRTTGYIKNVKTNKEGHDVVSTTAQNGKGDSGCPIYKEYENSGVYSVYIIGINAWGRDGSDCPFSKSGGNIIEYIENKLKVKV